MSTIDIQDLEKQIDRLRIDLLDAERATGDFDGGTDDDAMRATAKASTTKATLDAGLALHFDLSRTSKAPTTNDSNVVSLDQRLRMSGVIELMAADLSKGSTLKQAIRRRLGTLSPTEMAAFHAIAHEDFLRNQSEQTRRADTAESFRRAARSEKV